MYERLKQETDGIDNIHVASFRIDSIWGASSLYHVCCLCTPLTCLLIHTLALTHVNTREHSRSHTPLPISLCSLHMQVYTRGIEYLLQYEWDYFVNLSGADLPLRPIDDLAAFLQPYVQLKYSFLAGHGSDHERFIKRQGWCARERGRCLCCIVCSYWIAAQSHDLTHDLTHGGGVAEYAGGLHRV